MLCSAALGFILLSLHALAAAAAASGDADRISAVASSPVKNETCLLQQITLRRATHSVAASRTAVQPPPGGGAWADGCRHVFLDVGANRGVHVRALFQPNEYSKSLMQPVFDSLFGEQAARQRPSNESGICAFGFEGNELFAARHKEIESVYAAHGWRVKFFTPLIVETKDETEDFYINDEEYNMDIGSSIIDRGHGDAPGRRWEKVSVPAVDFAAFVAEHIVKRKMPPGSLPGKVFMKMDIEGAEFDVLPAMRDAGLLCQGGIDAMFCEEHTRIIAAAGNAQPSRPSWPDILLSVKEQPACSAPTDIQDVDDESYLHDTVPLPA